MILKGKAIGFINNLKRGGTVLNNLIDEIVVHVLDIMCAIETNFGGG